MFRLSFTKLALSFLSILFSFPVFGQSRLDNEYVIGLKVEVPTGVFSQGQVQLADGLPRESHQQKQSPGFGFQMGAIFNHRSVGLSSRYLFGYVTHSGKHEVERNTGGTLFAFDTKYQAISASAELLFPILGRQSGVFLSSGLSYDMETFDIERGKKETYNGNRISLACGVGNVFRSRDISWSVEVGLRTTVFGSFSVNGDEFVKRNTFYIATSAHF